MIKNKQEDKFETIPNQPEGYLKGIVPPGEKEFPPLIKKAK